MPLYEYRCQHCGKVFEQLRSMERADEGVVCPTCASEEVERLLSAFSSKARVCSGGAGRRFT